MVEEIKSPQKRVFDRPLVRYGIAVVAVGLAYALRLSLAGYFGFGLTYITFNPAVMLAALLGGFGPGLLSTGLAALVVVFWILPPVGGFRLETTADAVGLGLFTAMGVFMSGVAGLYHRALQKVVAYEKDAAVRESEARFVAERKRAEERERDLEAHKLDFYRQTILAATRGKLLITDPPEIEEIVGPSMAFWEIRQSDDLAGIRRAALEIAESADVKGNRLHGFITSVGETTSNALKYAGGGIASLHKSEDSLFFAVTDEGPGIEALNLPGVALIEGYTTSGTLGMGYKLMMATTDRVYLATGPDGTTVAFEMRLNADAELPATIAGHWEG